MILYSFFSISVMSLRISYSLEVPNVSRYFLNGKVTFLSRDFPAPILSRGPLTRIASYTVWKLFNCKPRWTNSAENSADEGWRFGFRGISTTKYNLVRLRLQKVLFRKRVVWCLNIENRRSRFHEAMGRWKSRKKEVGYSTYLLSLSADMILNEFDIAGVWYTLGYNQLSWLIGERT